MLPLVAFYVTLTQSFVPANNQVVPYNNVIVNEGLAWDNASHSFKAPHSGIYFFSYGTATTASRATIAQLALNTAYVFTQSVYETTSHNDIETARASTMLSLNANDLITTIIYIFGSSSYYIDSQKS